MKDTERNNNNEVHQMTSSLVESDINIDEENALKIGSTGSISGGGAGGVAGANAS